MKLQRDRLSDSFTIEFSVCKQKNIEVLHVPIKVKNM